MSEILDYRATLLGELRLFDLFKVRYIDPDESWWWKVRVPEQSGPRAEMLRRIDSASRGWNLQMMYRRIQSTLTKAYEQMSPEWDLFDEVKE